MRFQKLALIFVGLFVLMTLGGIVLAYLNNMPIKYEEQLAEGFYYAAIGFAVYHLFTRNKQVREKQARGQEAAGADDGAADDEDDADEDAAFDDGMDDAGAGADAETVAVDGPDEAGPVHKS